MLVKGLPADAGTWCEQGWTRADEMRALLVELLSHWGQFIALGTGVKLDRVPEMHSMFNHPGRPEPAEAESENRRPNTVSIDEMVSLHRKGG